MELPFSIIIGGVIVVFCVWAYMLRRKEVRLSAREQAQGFVSLGDDAQSYVFGVLKEMGCNPEYIEEEPTRILFKFQGHTFVMICSNRPYGVIWNYNWGKFDLDSINLSYMQLAVNYVNASGFYNTNYEINSEDNTLELSTTYLLHLPDGMYDLKGYLKVSLEGFFQVYLLMRDAYNDVKKNDENGKPDDSNGNNVVWN